MSNTSCAPFASRAVARLRRQQQQRRRRHLLLLRRIALWMTALTLLLTMAAVFFLSMFCCCEGQGDGARNQSYEIAKAIQIFEVQHHRRPTSLDELVTTRPAIMEQLPRDPWGHAYLYVNPGVHNVDRFDVVSAGEDGLFFSGDDVGNWQER